MGQGIAAEAMGGTFAEGFEAGVLSAVQSGIYSGIGGAESLDGTPIPGLGEGITLERVLAHGVVGGTFAKARGDDFGSGFASGVFSKISAGTIAESLGKYSGAAASAIIGGTASAIAGGKFANGALSGAFGYLYNQWVHQGGHDVENNKAIMGNMNMTEPSLFKDIDALIDDPIKYYQCSIDCAKEVLNLSTAIKGGLVASGVNVIPTRRKGLGTTPRTSIASKLSRKVFGKSRFSKRYPPVSA